MAASLMPSGDAGQASADATSSAATDSHAAKACTAADSCGASSRAVGNFTPCTLQRLVKLLSIQDDALQREQFQQLARESKMDVPDGAFLASLRRSFMLCRRGALLYPRETELAISFNGGKDACVVLYLWLAAVASTSAIRCVRENGRAEANGAKNTAEANGAKNTAEAMSIGQQTVIYFDSPDEFPEVRSFVKWVVDSLGLSMVRVEQKSFKEGLGDLVKDGLQAVVMGQRRGDPWTEKMDAFSPSTDGWPPFMRINPIIDWSYADVWTFLRMFELPYCEMYDQGYTSLGNIMNTQKNPALRRPDGSFAPAYRLCDGSQERAGRSKLSSTSDSAPAKAGAASSETTRSSSSTASPRTAGIVIVGNELLSGKAKDENSHYLCCELRSRGVMVICIEVVPDDVAAIARTVSRLARACDFVFSSGGLGPTHDDVTMAGIASAFDTSLRSEERFFSMLAQQFCKEEDAPGCTDSARLHGREAAWRKVSSLPQGARVEWPDDGNPWPLVSVQNVYIFAGLPRVFREMFLRAAKDGRFEGSQGWASSRLWLDAPEEDITAALQRTVDEFPLVEIGSYPTAGAASNRGLLSITLEAFDAEQMEAAKRRFVGLLSAADLVVPEPAAECMQALKPNFAAVQQSTTTIKEGEVAAKEIASKPKRARTCADGGPIVATS